MLAVPTLGDQLDPRRRLPGSGMPPTAAPQLAMRIARAPRAAGSMPQMPPRAAANIIDPQVLMMLMRMLAGGGGATRAPAAGGAQPMAGTIGHESAAAPGPADTLGLLAGLLAQGGRHATPLDAVANPWPLPGGLPAWPG